jgi:EAL domain-containing protein (putative c-di-GMP-specific phosphodiesterase class I)
MKSRKKQTKWMLENVSDESGKWMIAIEPLPFTIGRDESCSLTLESKWVSMHHAEINTSGELLWIRDLGSTNGTFVNQRPIERSELIEPGDVIMLGKSNFLIKRASSIQCISEEDTVVLDLAEELSNLALIESKLRRLIHERDVIPHFQPILRFSDMLVTGYEVLGRISNEDLTSEIDEIFNIAALLNCSSELSCLFREKGVDLGSRLPGSPLLFVNTDPGELDRLDVLLESLKRIHKTAPPRQIVLEISEKARVHADEMQHFRDRLTDLDIAIAFDDFGVGQTRLVELAKAPPDFLKFDMSLMHNIHLAPKRLHQMVLTFVKAAQDLGIATLAEGIECIDEGETCRELGFEYVQGYFYGRPLPICEYGVS